MKIWDYINLNKTEDKIKENTKPDIPLIVAAPITPIAVSTAPIASAAAPIAPAATPASTRTAIYGLLS